MKLKSKTLVVILSVSFIIIGIPTLFYSISNMLEAKYSQNWPSIMGEILEIKIKEERLRKSSPNYYFKLKYKYNLDGYEYYSNRYSFGTETYSSKVRVEKIIEKLKKQEKILVFYDPNDPNSSVVETGIQYHHWGGMLAPLIFLILGVIFFGVYKVM